MESDNVIYMEPPKTLTPEQLDYWTGQAEYWEVQEGYAWTALEYAQRQRENALRMLGKLPIERGLAE